MTEIHELATINGHTNLHGYRVSPHEFLAAWSGILSNYAKNRSVLCLNDETFLFEWWLATVGFYCTLGVGMVNPSRSSFCVYNKFLFSPLAVEMNTYSSFNSQELQNESKSQINHN